MSLSSNIYTSKEQGNTTEVTKFFYLYVNYMSCVSIHNTSEMRRKTVNRNYYSFYKRNPFFKSSISGKCLFLNPKIQLISSVFDIPVPNLWYAKMFCSFDEGHVVLHPAGTCVGILIPVSCQPMIILSMVSAGILPITAAPHSNTPLMSSAVIFLHLSSIPSPIY